MLYSFCSYIQAPPHAAATSTFTSFDETVLEPRFAQLLSGINAEALPTAVEPLSVHCPYAASTFTSFDETVPVPRSAQLLSGIIVSTWVLYTKV